MIFGSGNLSGGLAFNRTNEPENTLFSKMECAGGT